MLGKCKDILIVLPMESDSNRKFMQGVSLYARTRGNWKAHFIDSARFSPECLSKLSTISIQAIIANENMVAPITEFFRERTPPISVFGTPNNHQPSNQAEYFSVDGVAIGTFAANYFKSLGKFASFGFYSEHLDLSFIHDRRAGFKSAVQAQGGIANECPSYGNTPATKTWLSRLQKPAAVFCSNIHYAIDLIEVCRQCKFNVPRQISVLGVDDDDILGGFTVPRPSTIALDYPELGFMAAKSIDRRMRNGKRGKDGSFALKKMRVVEYDSTAPLPPATHLVYNAMALIHQNKSHPIRVEDIARSLGVSRNLLSLRFREILNETVSDTILKARLDAVRIKLTTTTKSIRSITEECGFNNASYLKTCFKKHFGTTMSQYREQSRAI